METNRLKIYAASQEQMEAFVAEQTIDVLKEAYAEMEDDADGCYSICNHNDNNCIFNNHYQKTVTPCQSRGETKCASGSVLKYTF